MVLIFHFQCTLKCHLKFVRIGPVENFVNKLSLYHLIDFENIVEKAENAGKKHVLLVLHC